MLQIHQPQVRLDGYGRPADQRIEALQVGLEEPLIRQARIDGGQLGTEGPRLEWKQLIPQRALRIPQPQHGRPRKSRSGEPEREEAALGFPPRCVGQV